MLPQMKDWLLDELGNRADIPRELLGAIIAVEDAQPGEDFPGAAEIVWQYVTSGFVDHKPIMQKALGTRLSALNAEWSAIEEMLRNKLPKAFQPLAMRLKAFTSPLHYPVAASKSGSAAVGGVPIVLKANASLALTVQAHTAGVLQKSNIEFPMGADQLALRLGISSSILAGASTTVPQPWGKVALQGGAGATFGADAYFRQPDTRVLAVALLKVLDEIPAPGNLESALRVATKQDGSFAQTRVMIKGTLSAGGEINAGFGKVYEFASFSPGAPKIELTAALSASLSGSWKHEDSYELVVTAVAGGVRVSLDLERSDEVSRMFKLGADVGVSGLAENLDAVLKAALPDAQPLIDRINKNVDLSGILHGKLAAKGWLKDGTVKNALTRLAIGDISVQQVEDSLVEWIVGQVESWLGRHTIWLSADATALGEKFVNEVAAGWGIEDKALEGIAKLVGKRIHDAQTDAQAEIDKLVGSLKAELSADAKALDPLLKPFEWVGRQVADIVNEIQSNATKAANSITDWLRKYSAVRMELLTHVAKIAEERIVLSMSGSSSRKLGDSSLISATFRRASPAAEALYCAMWTGRIERLKELVAAAEANDDVIDVSGQLHYTFVQSTEMNFTLNLLGLKFTSGESTLVDVQIETDLGGRITAAHGTGDIKSYTTGCNEKYDSQLGFDLDMLEGLGGSAVPFPLVSTFSAADADLSREELDEFLDSLSLFGLVRKGIGESVWQMMSQGMGPRVAVLKDVGLHLKCLFSAGDLRNILGMDRDDVYAAASSQVLRYAQRTLDSRQLTEFSQALLNSAMGEETSA